jgi:hypothetical protein
MTTLVRNKLDNFTLQINDKDLHDEFTKKRYEELNDISKKIFYGRMLYGIWVCIQMPLYGMKFMRLTYYVIFTLSQLIFIRMAKRIPFLHVYHSSFAIMSFCSFVMNDPKSYYDASDHLTLMIGFVAITFLSSMFLSVNWMYSMIGLLFGIGVVAYYYTILLDYRMLTICLTMTITMCSCGYISYYTEYVRKKLFLQTKYQATL